MLAGLRAPYANQVAQTRKCSELLDRARQRLADARASHATAGAASPISAIDTPDTGTRPVGPGRATIVLVGLFGGLFAGFGVVLLTVNPVEGTPRHAAPAAPEQERQAPRGSQAIEAAVSAMPRVAKHANGHSNGNGRRRPIPVRGGLTMQEALKKLASSGRTTR